MIPEHGSRLWNRTEKGTGRNRVARPGRAWTPWAA